MSIFIPQNVPSSKNSRQWTGKFFIASKNTRDYIKNTDSFWVVNKPLFLSKLEGKNKPYKISFLFVRKSKHKFDYINPAQTIQDLMVKYGWLNDDNCDEIIPVFLPYKYDPKNAGVFIDVID